MKINKKIFITLIFIILLIFVISLIILNKSRTTITSSIGKTTENEESSIVSSMSSTPSSEDAFLYNENSSVNTVKVVGDPGDGIAVVHNKVNPDGTLTVEPYTPSNNSNSNSIAQYIPEGVQPADSRRLYNEDGTLATYSSPSSEEVNYKKTPDKVTMKIDENTLTNSGVTLIITDNNKYQYAWGPGFGLQIKENDNWKDMRPIKDLVFNEIAYKLDENNQWKYKINWEEFYSKLEKGTYRISKTIYDNGYINLYSNEFEIK